MTNNPTGNTPPAPQQPAYGQPAAPAYGQPPAAPAYGQPAYGAAPARTNTLAIVALIAGIAGLTLLPGVASIVAIITGHMSLSRLKTSGENGRGMALGGTIMGWIGIALAILGVIIAIVTYAAIMAEYGDLL